jgi:hypothetical protein
MQADVHVGIKGGEPCGERAKSFGVHVGRGGAGRPPGRHRARGQLRHAAQQRAARGALIRCQVYVCLEVQKLRAKRIGRGCVGVGCTGRNPRCVSPTVRDGRSGGLAHGGLGRGGARRGGCAAPLAGGGVCGGAAGGRMRGEGGEGVQHARGGVVAASRRAGKEQRGASVRAGGGRSACATPARALPLPPRARGSAAPSDDAQEAGHRLGARQRRGAAQ